MSNYYLQTYSAITIPDLGGLSFPSGVTVNLSNFARNDEIEQSVEHGDLKVIYLANTAQIVNDAGDIVTYLTFAKLYKAVDVKIDPIATYSSTNVQQALQELKDHIGTGGGGTVSSSTSVYNEFLTGARDSTNVDYTTIHNFVGGTTRFYLNGQRQTLGTDYTESGLRNIHLLKVTPKSWYHLIIDYDI